MNFSLEIQTAEEIEQGNLEEQSEIVRVKRDKLLSETDWIVVKSLEVGEPIPSDWGIYRQELRDITSQEGFPFEVSWPVKP